MEQYISQNDTKIENPTHKTSNILSKWKCLPFAFN